MPAAASDSGLSNEPVLAMTSGQGRRRDIKEETFWKDRKMTSAPEMGMVVYVVALGVGERILVWFDQV